MEGIIFLLVASGFLFGVATGIMFTRREIRIAITKADICRDDKRMIRSVLGIPELENGERQ